MRLDSTQRSWFFISVAIFVLSLAIYIPYTLTSAKGPTGGSAFGLAFGFVGFAFMLFAAALGARQARPHVATRARAGVDARPSLAWLSLAAGR